MAHTPVGPEVAEYASVGPGRHEARERALSLLYESEARELTASELLEQLPMAPNAYAAAAVLGVEAGLSHIDNLINDHADGWTVERLPNVDRAILRLAIWELVDQPKIPAAVIIDEAIELAKEYSTERSASFVNGVLDSIAHEVRTI